MLIRCFQWNYENQEEEDEWRGIVEVIDNLAKRSFMRTLSSTVGSNAFLCHKCKCKAEVLSGLRAKVHEAEKELIKFIGGFMSTSVSRPCNDVSNGISRKRLFEVGQGSQHSKVARNESQHTESQDLQIISEEQVINIGAAETG